MTAKKEATNNDILEAVELLSKSVDKRLKENNDSILVAVDKRLDTHKSDILEAVELFAQNVDKRFDGVDKRFDRLENELRLFKSETASSFAYIHADIKYIKERLEKLEKRTIEDADAAAQDILELRKRIDLLERQLKQLQSARA